MNENESGFMHMLNFPSMNQDQNILISLWNYYIFVIGYYNLKEYNTACLVCDLLKHFYGLSKLFLWYLKDIFIVSIVSLY